MHPRPPTASRLAEIYDRLFDHFGPQHWWPGETPLEILVGAVLTQNTNWQNVSRAIDNLRQENLLSLEALHGLALPELAALIRPAGYFNLKAARLRNLLNMLADQFDNSLELAAGEPGPALRRKLLAVKGIGPETADSILLYAFAKPAFVVDTYTHRFLSRHGLIAEDDGYYEIQELFIDSLPEDVGLFNEFHALIVRLGKEFCRKSKPRCTGCPLDGI